MVVNNSTTKKNNFRNFDVSIERAKAVNPRNPATTIVIAYKANKCKAKTVFLFWSILIVPIQELNLGLIILLDELG